VSPLYTTRGGERQYRGERPRWRIRYPASARPSKRSYQHARYLPRPRRRHRDRIDLAARRQQRGTQRVESQRAPQGPSQPHVAERPPPLDAESREAHRHGLLTRRGLFEQLPLIRATGDRLRQQPGVRSPFAVELAELGDRLLHDRAARRTERTSRQYGCALPPFRTTVCRRYTCTAVRHRSAPHWTSFRAHARPFGPGRPSAIDRLSVPLPCLHRAEGALCATAR